MYKGTGQQTKFEYKPELKGVKSILHKSNFVKENVMGGRSNSVATGEEAYLEVAQKVTKKGLILQHLFDLR